MKKSCFYILCFIFPLLFAYCAKMGSITGGPRDEDPPRVVSSRPANYSTDFTGNRIEITFDEFIALNNVNQALVISPPFAGKPDIRLRGKTLQIFLEGGEFRENTTYTFNFGNSIEDNNERNVLENFEFVFSTGPYLDSLSVAGTIVNSFNLRPIDDPFIIMAYDKLEDSIPIQEIPVYIGRSDKEGAFMINNMKADTFRIFALKDLNFNLLYDLPNENIAFYDSLVYLFPELLQTNIPDTAQADSILMDTNDIEKDSTIRKRDIPYSSLRPYFMELFFFEEDNRKQYLMDEERKEDKHIFLAFNLPVEESLQIQGLNFDSENWYYEEVNILRDTFNLWIRDQDLIKSDSLIMLLGYPGTDSLGNYMLVEDTLNLFTRQMKQVRGKQGEQEKKQVLTVNTIPNNTRQDLHKNILFNFNYPVEIVDTSKIFLFSIPDSLEISEIYAIKEDSLTLRKRYLEHPWKSQEKYRFFAEPGAFADFYGNMSDTLNINFTAQDEEYYGILQVNTSNVSCPLIVQLMDEKEVLFEERYIQADSTITFDFLRPGNYKVKYIYDTNNNGKWDTGRYLEGRQPERVEYYEGEIVIRSNWEMEIKWGMKHSF